MPNARDHYQNELRQIEQRMTQLVFRNQQYAVMRVAVFLAAAAFLAAGFSGLPLAWLLQALGLLGIVAFLVVITIHEYIRLSIWRADRDGELYRRMLARLDRRWNDIPVPTIHLPPASAAVADDLDITGRASLLHWACLAETEPAKTRLANWFIEPATADSMRQRQQAVEELSSEIELRERVYSIAKQVAYSSASPERFAKWAASAPWLTSKRWLLWLSRVGPALVILGLLIFLVQLTGLVPSKLEIPSALFVAGVILNLIVSVGFGSHIHDLFLNISSKQQEIASYRELMELLVHQQWKSKMLQGLGCKLTASGSSSRALQSLERRMSMAAIRHSPLLFPLYLLFQLLFAWDFRTLEVIEKWQVEHGSQVTGWFDALADFETLCSVAAIRFEQPQWAYPVFRSAADCGIDAEAIAHPLLPDEKRVCNDLSLGKQTPLLLVTGSNMSGKSTLLRSLGLNALLARTGAPVCATKFDAPPCILATSIRVRDSLDQGVSYFMAELKRLREVVDIAASNVGNKEHRVLFLLDEIMQGTNSRERHVAVGHVVEQLMKLGAFGAVSTHDLDLATHELLESKTLVVHFREHVVLDQGERKMTFDYRMRPGPTPTTNALKLLALVGLGGPEAELDAKNDQDVG